MRFLVVDDEVDLRLILQMNLQRWGHEVAVAASAAEAWTAIHADTPDVLLLDVSMPGETGVELVTRLRAAGRLPERVALLSAILPSALAQQAEMGGVRHLAKPFSLLELRSLVEALAAT